MNDTPPRETRRLVVTGHVQGVCYRASMAQEAQTLGVTGWVRNRADGSVEAMVCGTPEQLAAIVLWARRGPTAARVEQVAVEEAVGDFTGFEQRASV